MKNYEKSLVRACAPAEAAPPINLEFRDDGPPGGGG